MGTSINRTRDSGQATFAHECCSQSPALRIALYSHDTMGLGHMRRNLLIAQALRAQMPSATLLIISGAREASTYWMPPGVDCLTLPALSKEGAGRYTSRSLTLALDELVALRGRLILSAVQSFAPNVFVVDNVPRGALQELDATLEHLRDCRHTRCVLGLRDVLDDPVTVAHEWKASENLDAVRRYYDAVWVYGDRRVYDLPREYGWPSDLADRISFTGYFDQRRRFAPEEFAAQQDPTLANGHTELALCMVGGGQDGVDLADAFTRATFPRSMQGLLLLGPYMPHATRQEISERVRARPNLRTLDFHAEPTALLRQAHRVIAMGGYNTTYEILSFDKPALIVPRVRPRQEQWIRAERLQALGLLDVMHPDHVAPETVSHWLAGQPRAPSQSRTHLDFSAIERLPRLLARLMSTDTPHYRRRDT